MANITKRQHKDGAWAYTFKVYRGRDPETKKQLTPFTNTWVAPATWSEKKADKEAEKQAAIFEDKCKNNQISTKRESFYTYAEYVIDFKESQQIIKHNTVLDYRRMNKNLKNIFGYSKIAEITADGLNSLYMRLSKTNFNKSDKPLSPKSVLEYHNFISSVLSQAVEEGIIVFNPARIAKPPKRRKKEVNYYQEDIALEILKFAKNEPLKWQLAINLLFDTAGRRGEILGLKWAKIDWKLSRCKIDEQILYNKDTGIRVAPTKEDDVRICSLSSETIRLLKTYKAEQAQNQLKFGDEWKGEGHIFTQWNGLPMHPDSLNTYLSRFAAKYELPHLNPHAFRHTSATLMFANAVDVITISKKLGHSKPSTTMDMYGHTFNKSEKQAAEVLHKALKKS